MNNTNKSTNTILSIITWTFILIMALFAATSAIAAPKIRPPAPFTEVQLSPHFTWEKVPEEEYALVKQQWATTWGVKYPERNTISNVYKARLTGKYSNVTVYCHYATPAHITGKPSKKKLWALHVHDYPYLPAIAAYDRPMHSRVCTQPLNKKVKLDMLYGVFWGDDWK